MIAARVAQQKWAIVPVAVRLRFVRRLRHLIAEYAVELATEIQECRQISQAEVLAGEVLPLAEACRFLEREAEKLLRPRRLKRGRPLWLTGVQAEIHREPFGIVLVIGPSNYPLFLAGVQAIQALVAGNAVIWKPGNGGGPVAKHLARLCLEAGLGEDLLIVQSEAPEAAIQAIEQGVDKVVLTGHVDTGRKVLQLLAPRIIPAIVELSGYDAAFILADADLDLVVNALRFALTWNHSETCIAPRRVFVHESIAFELEKRLQAILHNMRESRPLSEAAVEMIEEAIAQGARKLEVTGATIILDANADMRLLQEEVFGPILTIVPVKDDDEALQAAARCPFELGATIFGKDPHARALAKRIRAGAVIINDVIVPTADPRLPFGGRGISSYGVTRGAEGLLELTTVKVVSTRRGRARHLELSVTAMNDLVVDYIRAIHGTGVCGRISAMWRVIRGVRRIVFRSGEK